MRSPDDHAGGNAPRALIIDLDELCWTLNLRDPSGLCSPCLDLESGHLLGLTDPTR